MRVFEIIESPASRSEPGSVDPADGDRVIWVRAECISHVQAALACQQIPHVPNALNLVHEIQSSTDFHQDDLDLEIDSDGIASEVARW